MADTYIQNFSANFSHAHVIYAVDQIITQLANTQDEASVKIFDSVARASVARSTLYKSVTPYCNIIIGAPTVVDHSIEGFVETLRVPITAEAIFKVASRNADNTGIDIQAWAEWLWERMLLTLQPYNAIDTPLGIQRTTPWVWNYSDDWNLKNKQSRSITEVEGTGKPLTGSAWALRSTFNIDVWPFVPLP